MTMAQDTQPQQASQSPPTPTWDEVALEDVQSILHNLVDRVRVHSEPELEYLHKLVHKLDPSWSPPTATNAAEGVDVPGLGTVSPQEFAAFRAYQEQKQQEAARAEAAATAAAQPWNQGAAAAAAAPTTEPPAPKDPNDATPPGSVGAPEPF